MVQHRFPLSVADKHHLLFLSSTPPAQLTAMGDRYREAGLLHDALEFYQAAKDGPALERLLGEAVERCDLVLLLNAFRALEKDPRPDALAALREKAAGAGKESVAARAASLLVSAR